MRDLSRGRARYNSPTFCGVCDPESRDNRDILVKGTYFLSTDRLGSHNIVAGYDNFTGQQQVEQLPVGEQLPALHDVRDLSGTGTSTRSSTRTPTSTTRRSRHSARVRTRLTHSVFVNDSWRLSDRISLNLGVRWDKNDAKDSRGVVTANDSAFSPRLGASWDVTGIREAQGLGELREVRRGDPGQPRELRLRRRLGVDLHLVLRRHGRGADQREPDSRRDARDARAGAAAGLQLVLRAGLPEPLDLQASARVREHPGPHDPFQPSP